MYTPENSPANDCSRQASIDLILHNRIGRVPYNGIQLSGGGDTQFGSIPDETLRFVPLAFGFHWPDGNRDQEKLQVTLSNGLGRVGLAGEPLDETTARQLILKAKISRARLDSFTVYTHLHYLALRQRVNHSNIVLRREGVPRAIVQISSDVTNPTSPIEHLWFPTIITPQSALEELQAAGRQ